MEKTIEKLDCIVKKIKMHPEFASNLTHSLSRHILSESECHSVDIEQCH